MERESYFKSTTFHWSPSKSIFSNADLTGANLAGADFIGPNLEGTILPDGYAVNKYSIILPQTV